MLTMFFHNSALNPFGRNISKIIIPIFPNIILNYVRKFSDTYGISKNLLAMTCCFIL